MIINCICVYNISDQIQSFSFMGIKQLCGYEYVVCFVFVYMCKDIGFNGCWDKVQLCFGQFELGVIGCDCDIIYIGNIDFIVKGFFVDVFN